MQFALDTAGARISAQRGIDATCPQCSSRVIAKCGQLVIHHWAHEAVSECDPWWEHESEWHRSWKALVPPERTEVTRGPHRADIVRSDGTVVELQHSPISVDEIRERENFYGKMIWLFDGRNIDADGDYRRLLLRPKTSGSITDVTFRFKHPRKHYGMCNAPVYVDLGNIDFWYGDIHYKGDAVLHLKKLFLERPPYGGYGTLGEADAFRIWVRV